MCQIILLHLVHIRAFYLKNWIFEMILKIWCFVNYLVFFMILDTKRHVLPLGNNITNHHLNGVWFFPNAIVGCGQKHNQMTKIYF